MKYLVSIVLLITLSFNLKADILLNETFPSSSLPAGWTNTALQGSDIWLIRNAPLFGSSSGGNYAVFDDQLLGAAVIPNEAALASPVIDCSNRTAIFLSYSHHWFGVEFTHGYVEVSNNGGGTWTIVKDYHKLTRGSLATPQDTVLDISALAANQPSVKIRFRYTDGSQAGKFWYLDDIKVYADPDAGVSNLIAPSYLGCGQTYTATETVTIEVTNYGVNPISNIPVTCDVTGATTATLTGTVPGPIAAGATATYTFPSTLNMSANGIYNFYCYTTLVNDEYIFNDTLYDSRQQLVVSTYPYTQDFNGTTAGWQATGQAPPLNNGRNFYHGSLPYLNGAQGMGDSWYVETTSSNNGTFIWVESPVFDFSSLSNPQLTFDIKHSLHSSDYFHVEYSLNGGTTWTQLGSGTDPYWYNNASWWQNSYAAPVDQWTQVQHNLCALAGQSCVKLRIYGRPYYSAP
ncbi:MAG: choice-of-anchor J domain-containing protein, partial [Flavobacteriales bacterium]|nr:choice-of-anchor J domain-containing protein [Flavobacteriales bacterium]